MIPGGYILQPRAIDESNFIHEAPVNRELWFYFLRKVNHKKNGKYERGQGFFTLGDIAEGLHWWIGYRKMKYSKPQLTKTLRRLCERNMIETTKATRGVIVTICNYDFYQTPANYEGNNEESAKETRKKSQGITKNKNDKNEINTYGQHALPENDFEHFWSTYNKKTDRTKCETIWKRISKNEKHEIWKALPDYIDSTPDKKYRKNPLTYLNGKCWNDELTQKNNPSSGKMPSELKDKIFNKSYNPIV